jgi:glycolate oxidase FAD binding subunit
VRRWATDLGWSEDFVPSLALKLSAPRRVIPSLAEACLRIGLLETPSEVLADPGFGTVRVLFWGDSDDEGILEAVEEARKAARRHDGTAVVEVCHSSVKVKLDVWGSEPGSMEIMRRIKEQFDPQRLLNRGRFLGRM